jgi:hypothetical protein
MDLVQRAKALGVSAAGVLTRPELIDEILSAIVEDEQERSQARGFLGRARDLVARVVEKGLHLPDAAQRILSPPSVTPAEAPKPLATVALASVYAKQGHRAQALCVLEDVLSTDPHNAAALSLRSQLDRSSPVVTEEPVGEEPEAQARPPSTPPAVTEPAACEPPQVTPSSEVPKQDVLDVVRDGHRLTLSWRVRPVTFARTRGKMPSGRLVLRVVHAIVAGQDTEMRTEDQPIDRLAGTLTTNIPQDALSSHVALGWRDGDMFAVLLTSRT